LLLSVPSSPNTSVRPWQDELLAIGHALARRDRLFAAHMRNYGDHLLEAVEEVLSVARETGCRLQVSHLAVAGRRNWGKVTRALELIDVARRDGIDVASDIYPYTAGSANLSQLLPGWAQAGGAPAIVARLGREAERTRILARLRDRGRVVEGAFADLVAFDPRTVTDAATFREPGRYPTGIEHVVLAGVPVVRGAVQTDARPGAILLA